MTCFIPIPDIAMDQYGYMVFRYVLFCGIAGLCRPSVTVVSGGGKCLFARTDEGSVRRGPHTQTIVPRCLYCERD
jgi:hypothetical protein